MHPNRVLPADLENGNNYNDPQAVKRSDETSQPQADLAAQHNVKSVGITSTRSPQTVNNLKT